MKQLMYLSPGNLEWQEAPEPKLQGPNDAIVRALSVATCDLDGAVIRGMAPVPGPYPFGHEAIAEVLEVGPEVTSVRPGDTVLVPFQISCGTCGPCSRGLTGSCDTAGARSAFGLGPIGGLQWGGALADYTRVPFADAMLVKMPADSGALASLADNIPDGWRAVAPHLEARPGSPVLVLGGAGPSSVALYGVAVAVAMGAPVDYVDYDRGRLEIAEKLGANPIEITVGQYPRRYGPYPIVQDHTSNTDGLGCAIRSTEPGGVCTSTAIYFQPETGMPILEMYTQRPHVHHRPRQRARPHRGATQALRLWQVPPGAGDERDGLLGRCDRRAEELHDEAGDLAQLSSLRRPHAGDRAVGAVHLLRLADRVLHRRRRREADVAWDSRVFRARDEDAAGVAQALERVRGEDAVHRVERVAEAVLLDVARRASRTRRRSAR